MSATTDSMDTKKLAGLSLAALGVVFGDIGTSPLYALRECFHGEFGIEVSRANVLGVVSLIVWAMLLIVTVKYLAFILRADNEGEGGVLALTALIKPKNVKPRTIQWTMVGMGLFAACLLYGDGIITPAISVLSAVEGIKGIAPVFESSVIPVTIVILAGLFLIQRRGTARVGRLFGPIMLLWFTVLATLGLIQVLQSPQILAALAPWHGLAFLVTNKLHGFIVLGAVFLAVTGAEAIYADMGHFGRKPIRLTWLFVAFPALALNYLGQGALLLTQPEASHHPFYALVPDWAMVPMVLLSTMATIIASQAVITGSFSLTRQAIQLGYLPRLRITHTSSAHMGQIYVAPVNWILMLCTIGLVVGFQSSSKLAAAYGIAVTTTMLITTLLFYVVARKRWGWNRLAAGLVTALFFAVDLPFFAANMTKILHGAWFPLALAGCSFLIMITWEQGREILGTQMAAITTRLDVFKTMLAKTPPQRISGQAIFLTRNHDTVPAALMHNLKHNKILHSEVVFLNIRTEEIPRVPNFEKIEAEKLGSGLYRIIAHYGFMEEPQIGTIFALARDKGVNLDLQNASFFLGREKLSIGDHPRMSRWRSNLFLFMTRNAMDAAAFFDIPPDQVIEVGVQLEL
ncbi:MAG: potassium transporter Kup [Thermodesulfobacteriota bacterium]